MLKLQKPNFSSLKNIFSAKRKTILIALALILVFAAGGLWFANQSGAPQKKNKEIVQKLENLNKKEEANCGEVIRELGSTPASDLKNDEDRIDLLNKQMFCFSDQKKFDPALAAAEQLKQIYTNKNDQKNLIKINRYIEELKENKKDVETDGSN